MPVAPRTGPSLTLPVAWPELPAPHRQVPLVLIVRNQGSSTFSAQDPATSPLQTKQQGENSMYCQVSILMNQADRGSNPTSATSWVCGLESVTCPL